MGTIHLTDQTFETAKQRAKDAGFDNVDEYIEDILSDEFATNATGYEFMSEQLSKIDEGLADVKSGRVTTLEEMNRRLAETKAKWLQENRFCLHRQSTTNY